MCTVAPFAPGHRRQPELAGDDRRVTERAALFDDECAEHREDRVERRADERGDEDVARLEPLERIGCAYDDASPTRYVTLPIPTP